MDCASFIGGFVLGTIGDIMVAILFIKLRPRAARTLLKQISVKPIEAPRRADGDGFWLVELKVGKGNWLTKVYGEKATTRICTFVKFREVERVWRGVLSRYTET